MVEGGGVHKDGQGINSPRMGGMESNSSRREAEMLWRRASVLREFVVDLLWVASLVSDWSKASTGNHTACCGHVIYTVSNRIR